MRDRNWLPMVMALLLVSTGCATQREWGVWRSHSTHFATDDHLGFSVTNAVVIVAMLAVFGLAVAVPMRGRRHDTGRKDKP